MGFLGGRENERKRKWKRKGKEKDKKRKVLKVKKASKGYTVK